MKDKYRQNPACFQPSKNLFVSDVGTRLELKRLVCRFRTIEKNIQFSVYKNQQSNGRIRPYLTIVG